MFLINLNAEIVACMLSFRKSRHKPNLESSSKYGFPPDLVGKNGGVLSMRMQVILDSSFARPGSAPIWGGKKGEFRDWTRLAPYLKMFIIVMLVIWQSFMLLSKKEQLDHFLVISSWAIRSTMLISGGNSLKC